MLRELLFNIVQLSIARQEQLWRWKALAEIYTMHSFAPFSWDPFSKLSFLFENR